MSREGQKSLDFFSEDNNDIDVFDIFDDSIETDIRKNGKKLEERQIVKDLSFFKDGIDKIITPMFPCEKCRNLPRDEKPEHVKKCGDCQQMIEEMDKTLIPGNKWLDQSMNPDEKISKEVDFNDIS